MPYFNSRDIAAIAMCATLWGVLNSIFAPIFFSIFHLPFFCDMIGFSALILGAWWIRKAGAITLIGAIATLINFALASNPYNFLGFTAAGLFFDLTVATYGYNRIFRKRTFTTLIMMTISTCSAALAGYIIGMFFMAGPVFTAMGGVLGWVGLHAIGGIVGGAIGTALVAGLDARKLNLRNTKLHQSQPNFIRDSE
jgi:hypothetical protein